MWIARDKNGWLGLFKDRPVRDLYRDLWTSTYMYCVLDDDPFPDLLWTDDPIEVMLCPK